MGRYLYIVYTYGKGVSKKVFIPLAYGSAPSLTDKNVDFGSVSGLRFGILNGRSRRENPFDNEY